MSVLMPSLRRLSASRSGKGRLGGDPAIIGRSIRVNGKLLRVVGVMPRSAQYRRRRVGAGGPAALRSRRQHVADRVGIRPSICSDVCAPAYRRKASQLETLALAARLRERWPDRVWEGEYLEARPILEFDRNSEEFKIVLTAAALVMLLLVAACANLGTLVLARGVNREREIRVRMALGASRLRIVRQLFTESLLLAALSGLSALLFSTIRPEGDSPAEQWKHERRSRVARGCCDVRRRVAVSTRFRAAARSPPHQPRAASRPCQADIPRRSGGGELPLDCCLESPRQQPAAAWRLGSGLRLSPSRLGFAGPQGPRLLRTCRAGVSRPPSRADRRFAGCESRIAGLARALGQPPHGIELDGTPVCRQSRRLEVSRHHGHASGARAQPSGRGDRRRDRQRGDGACAVAG